MIHWNSRLEKRRIDGEDHLGVESSAQTYQGYLLTGVITTTSRVRYFSFYAWVLHRFLQSHSHDLSLDAFKHFIQRYELAFILGCYYHHQIKQENILTGLIGGGPNNSTARTIWTKYDGYVDLDSQYLGAILGGLGQPYGTVIKNMSVMDERKRGDIPTLTKTIGRTLAEAFDRTVQGTQFYDLVTSSDPPSATISKNVIVDFGEKVCLCPDSIEHGEDREPLREMLFRFDIAFDLNHLHIARRLSLGLLLDLAHKANGYSIMDTNTMRRALYLGIYDVGQVYTPEPALEDWYFRWRMVMVRQMYTNGLQCLFRAFTDWVNDYEREADATFEAWLDEVNRQPDVMNIIDATLDEYLQGLCQDVGLSDWHSDDFGEYCTLQTGYDELTLFDVFESPERKNFFNTERLISRGLRILCQVALRSSLYKQNPLWADLRAKAGMLRLPLDSFIERLRSDAESGVTVGEFLKWLFRDYIIGQHEIVALNKLRYQMDNTFRFTYSNGVFYTEDANYEQPLRYPSLRLYNALQMLIDVGLIACDDDGGTYTTEDGTSYLARTVEGVES